MRIKKEIVAQSIQNYRDVWGKLYVYLDGSILKIHIKRKNIMKDGNNRIVFNHKDGAYSLQYDLDRHLVCRHHWYFTRNDPTLGSLVFKNYWYAHAFMLKMKKREAKK